MKDSYFKKICAGSINDLTKEDWKFLYHDKGMSLKQLSDLYGICITAIAKRLEKEGISRRGEGRVIENEISLESAKKLFDGGKSLTQISKELSCSFRMVKEVLAPFLSKKPKDVLTKCFLESYLNNGKTAYDVARDTGFNPPIIYKYLYKFGLKKKQCLIGEVGEAEIKRVVSLYRDGKTTTEIAELIGKVTGHVTDCLHSAGEPIRESNSYKTKIDYKQAAKMYEEGKSLSQIVDFFGGGSATLLAEKLRSMGVKVRSKSEALSGINNSMFGIKHSKSTREKMSKAYLDGIRELPDGPRGNSEDVDTPFQGIITVKSSWEAAVARYFNSLGTKYLYEDHVLKLVIDGMVVSYTPDFLVTDGSFPTYIEVKGLWTEGSKNKVKAALEAGYDLVVWDGYKLQELDILDSNLRAVT
jgi:hypothetical protein